MKSKQTLPDSWTSYRDATRLEIQEAIGNGPSSLRNMLRYHMGWVDEHGHPCDRPSGKFVRPALCLLSCQAVGGDTAQIMPAAAALELIHEFSLIHDDIQDASHERHHRPTVWTVWGQPQAINAGDAMLTLAFSALFKLKENVVADKRIVGSTRIVSLACLELCDGQSLDLGYEDRLDITVTDYLDMAAKKTAALFAASTSLGAYLGNEDTRLEGTFHLFGKELGMAYQIRDDIMGIWGTEESTGKSVGDIAQKKKTLPVVYALRSSNGKARQTLEKLYSQQSIEGQDIALVIKILGDLGARNYAEDLAEQYYCRALAQLEASRLDPATQAPLRETAGFLMKRDF